MCPCHLKLLPAAGQEMSGRFPMRRRSYVVMLAALLVTRAFSGSAFSERRVTSTREPCKSRYIRWLELCIYVCEWIACRCTAGVVIVRNRHLRATFRLHHDIRHRRQTRRRTTQDCREKLRPASWKNCSVSLLAHLFICCYSHGCGSTLR